MASEKLQRFWQKIKAPFTGRGKKKRRNRILLVVILVLIAVRIALPFFIVHYLNTKVLSDIAPYKGRVEDVDLHLFRGAYRICDLRIDSIDYYSEYPFLHAPLIDLSIQWKALFQGSLVGEIVMHEPEVNLKFSKSKSQTGKGVDWVQLAKDLMPININRFAIQDGKTNLAFLDGEDPQYGFDFKNVDVEVLNIRNTEDKENALPSPMYAMAGMVNDDGIFKLTGNANFLKTVPDFNYDARLEGADLKSLNEYWQFLLGIDFEEGGLNLYSEMAMKDGRFVGYFKPLLKDAKIFRFNEGDRSFFEGVKEFVAEGVQEIFEDHSEDQTASRVPIEGTIDKSAPNIWEAITSAFSNAYIQVFKAELDNTINLKDVKSRREAKKKKERKKEKEN